jgi:hypothetical protein
MREEEKKSLIDRLTLSEVRSSIDDRVCMSLKEKEIKNGWIIKRSNPG